MPPGAWAVLALVVLGCGSAFALRHRVQSGETLASIAALYAMSEAEIREFNRLEPSDRLRPGDIVFVPGAASRRAPAPGARETRSPEGAIGGETATPPRPAPPAPPPVSPPSPVEAPAASAREPSSRGETGRNLRWPLHGEVLRGFGTGPTGESRGIDIAAAPGTRVRAAGAGTVTYAGTPASAYGPLVIVAHEGGVFTVYGNLREFSVEKGQRVDAGQDVGTSGSRNGALPAHLHFEVRRGQDPRDPLLYLPPR